MKVKWPCDFPERWEILPAKRLFPESKERAAESDEQLSATQEYGVIAQAEFMRLAGRRVVQLNQNLDLRKRVEIGDFVISMRSFQGGLERAWAAGGIRSSYVVLKPRADLVRGYYQHLFKSQDYIQALQSTANFIRDGQDLNYQNFVLIELPCPPISEQHTIAAFLDYETARIDALIAEQQRLIELLKEKRQTVISHAVTKGLDPTAPMKDSGVEWLGEVPAHWEVGALRWYANIQGGIAKGKDYEGRETIILPYLRVANVQSGFVDLTEVKEISVLKSEVERYRLRAGDVLMNEGGDNDKLGRGTVWNGQISPCLHQNHVFAIRPNELLLPDWLAIFTQAEQARTYFYLSSKQSTNLASISARNVMSLSLPIPSVDEQKKILEYLGEHYQKHKDLVDVATLTIQLFQERRSALISAAVTGKIDVRGWQAPASATPALILEPTHG